MGINGEELADGLDRVRERLLTTVDRLPDEALLAPGTIGQWSVADVLAHLTVWEAELVTGMMKLHEGRKPGRLLQAVDNRDSYNAARHRENQGRNLDRIFDDLFQVRRQLERWLGRFGDRDLTQPGRYKWLPGRQSLADLVAENTFQHEARHLKEIEAYAEQWRAEAEQDANGTQIQLSDIEVTSHDNGG
jgi:uncharacterized damage-inducible protein DinB